MPTDAKRNAWPDTLQNAVKNIGKTLATANVEDKPLSEPVDLSDIVLDDPIQQQIEHLRKKMKEHYRDETKRPKTQAEMNEQKKEQADIKKWIGELGDPRFPAREHAFEELGKMGYSAKAQLTEAAKMREGADFEVVTRARKLLVPIDAIDKDIMSNLATTVTSLGYRKAAAKDAVPDLIKLFAEDDRDLKKTVIVSLGQIGPDAKDAVPILIKTLEDNRSKISDLDLKVPAMIALGQIGSNAKDAVPQLIEELKGNDTTYRQHAATALGQIKEIKHSLPALTFALSDEKVFEVKTEIIKSIGNFGPVATSAIPALRDVIYAKAPAFDDAHYNIPVEFYQLKGLATVAMQKIEHPKAVSLLTDQDRPEDEPHLFPPILPIPAPPIPTSKRGK